VNHPEISYIVEKRSNKFQMVAETSDKKVKGQKRAVVRLVSEPQGTSARIIPSRSLGCGRDLGSAIDAIIASAIAASPAAEQQLQQKQQFQFQQQEQP